MSKMIRVLMRRTRSFLMHIVSGTLQRRLLELAEERRRKQLERERIYSWVGYPFPGTQKFIYVLPEGARIYLYRNDKLSELIYAQNYEASERRFVLDYLKPGDVFIDVGANIGLFSIIAALSVGKNGQVISFEPASATYRRLCENIHLNDMASIIQTYLLAVSNIRETRQFNVSKGIYAAWNSFAVPVCDDRRFSKQMVDSVTLDDVVASNALPKISLLKVDVEGWELYVLWGAQSLLSSDQAPDILIEFTEATAASVGISLKEVYDWLIEQGYAFYRCNGQEKNIWREFYTGNYPYDNLLATKDIEQVIARTGYRLIE